MQPRRKRTLLLAVLLAVLVIWISRQEEIPQPAPLPPLCNEFLWDHVYRPKRLEITERCKAVEGTVIATREQADGDIHIKVLPDDSGLLNEVNHTKQNGCLVVELICVVRVRQQSAMEACAGFRQDDLLIPRLGSRVRIVGAYVRDTDHGWMEIHPVTRIDPIP